MTQEQTTYGSARVLLMNGTKTELMESKERPES